jgi:hypothetical protein
MRFCGLRDQQVRNDARHDDQKESVRRHGDLSYESVCARLLASLRVHEHLDRPGIGKDDFLAESRSRTRRAAASNCDAAFAK